MIARSSEELEVPMHKLRITPNRPIGLAFDIADLMVLESWSETHNIRMVVELDHCVEDEEYEEDEMRAIQFVPYGLGRALPAGMPQNP